MKSLIAFTLAAMAAAGYGKPFWDRYDGVSETDDETIAPVVVLHGLNGDCPQIAGWVSRIEMEIGSQAVVKCIEIGDGKTTSIFERMDWQVKTVCHKIHNDPDFSGKEISIVGISQGGLIARSVVEQCEGL